MKSNHDVRHINKSQTTKFPWIHYFY